MRNQTSTVEGQISPAVDSTNAIPYRPLPPIQTVFPKPVPPKPKPEPLTDHQLENWRTHLLRVVGPYAMLLNNAEINAIRDEIQSRYSAIANAVEGRTEQAPSVSEATKSDSASDSPKSGTITSTASSSTKEGAATLRDETLPASEQSTREG